MRMVAGERCAGECARGLRVRLRAGRRGGGSAARTVAAAVGGLVHSAVGLELGGGIAQPPYAAALG